MSFEVVIDGQKCRCTIEKDAVTVLSEKLEPTCDTEGSSVDAADYTVTLAFDDIINITQEDAEPTNSDKSKPDQSTSEPNTLLHFIKRKKDDPVWKKEIIKMSPSSEEKEDYGKLLEEIRLKFDRVVETRPKKLLVLVNPIAGKRMAKTMYDTVMTPLFELANIHTELVVSERPKHFVDLVASYDCKSVDGIVILGGDGTLYEVTNVLLRRTQQEAGIDINDETASLTPFSTPLAIIPTGTGNGVARCQFGCMDVTTATLHVIKGKYKPYPGFGNYCDGKLVGYGTILMGLGVVADMVYIADTKLRWMKTARYIVLLFLYLIRTIRRFDVEVTVVRSKRISTGEGGDSKEEIVEEVLETIHQQSCMMMAGPGEFLDNIGYNRSQDDPDSSRQLSMIWYEPIGKLELIRHFSDLLSDRNKENVFKKDYIKVLIGNSFRIKINESPENTNIYNRMVNMDGEIEMCSQPEYVLRPLDGLLNMFSSYERK